MNDTANIVERVIGLDAHPDSFTAAILRGPTPAAAVVEKVYNKVPMAQLTNWAQKHTTAQDQIVLEASLLIEGAQAILRCRQTALARWGRKLLAAKGSVNLAVAAIARKLTVALWYLMRGRWTTLEELDARLLRKVSHLIGAVGPSGLKALGKSRQAYREEICQRLKSGRSYVLDPNKKYVPQPTANPA